MSTWFGKLLGFLRYREYSSLRDLGRYTYWASLYRLSINIVYNNDDYMV